MLDSGIRCGGHTHRQGTATNITTYMLKDIKYTGLNTVSSGYDATAGQLAVAHNVINERGYIEPMTQPHELLKYTQANELEGFRCVFRHEMLSGVVNNIFFMPDDESSDSSDASSGEVIGTFKYLSANASSAHAAQPITVSEVAGAELFEVTAVGNTLCVLTSAGMDYFIWKGGEYKELGTELPFVNLQFGLEMKFDHELNGWYGKYVENVVTDHDSYATAGDTAEQRERIKNAIATALAVTRNSAAKQNKFIEPFLVRYAIRLFDGTYIHHSNPVLMQPLGSFGIPFLWYALVLQDMRHTMFLSLDTKLAALKMLFYDENNLADWKDIISGVDVFVSQPIVHKDYENIINYNGANPYDHDPDRATDSGIYSIGKFTDEPSYPSSHTGTSTDYYQYYSNIDVYPGSNINDPLNTYGAYHTFRFADNDVTPDKISLFYKIKELTIDELQGYTTLTDLDIPYEKLLNLAVQPTLPDDYRSHDQIISHKAYTYNQRINLFDVQRQSWNRLMPQTYLPYMNSNDSADRSDSPRAMMYITVDDEQGENIMEPDYEVDNLYPVLLENVRYIYVPYANAKSLSLYAKVSDQNVYKKTKVNLKKHPFLNGAVFFNEWESAPYSEVASSDLPADTTKIVYPEPNKIYTSEVGNPFYFPIGGINTVGTGRIIALATNVRAISQGQFGEFPLYVFTESGIWMLEVDDKGLYKAKQPMSLDVIEPNSQVTSVDNAVAYVIKRGLMLVSGAETKCISEALDGIAEPTPDLEIIGGKTEQFNWNEYKKGAVCAYDNVNQRLHVYNPNYAFDWEHNEKPYYHYVYSLKTGLWSTVEDDNLLLSTINGRYINTASGLLDVTFEEDNHDALTQTILTRPVNFETDAYKRMRDNIQRGDLDVLRTTSTYNVKVLLQGSDDLHNWHNIGGVSKHYRIVRKSGTPHKWFRWMIVIGCKPKAYRLHGLTAEVEVTGNNKLR